MFFVKPDNAIFLQLWDASPERAPFAHPGYLSLWEDEKTEAIAAVQKVVGGHVLYPFLLRSLKNEAFWHPHCEGIYDIISPYGYGGPEFVPDKGVTISPKKKEQLFRHFYDAFRQWAINKRVVSEFVRFSLFSEARNQFTGLVENPINNVVVNLRHSLPEIWKSFPYRVRRDIKIAGQADLKVLEDPQGKRLDDFLRVYYDTMRRRRASTFYFFTKEWFEHLIAQMPGCFTFFHTLSNETVVASELVLLSRNCAYSFLSSTLNTYFKLRPGHILKHHLIEWAHENGYSDIVLGGGHKPHDGIFAFKKSFAPKGVIPFYTGKNIFNQSMYDQLSAGQTKNTGFFPAYRER